MASRCSPPQMNDPAPLSQLGSAQFRRRIGAGSAATWVLALAILGLSGPGATLGVADQRPDGLQHAQDLFDVERLRAKAQEQVAIGRGFLVTRDGLFTEDARLARLELEQLEDRVARHVQTEEERKALGRVVAAGRVHEDSLQQAYKLARDKRLSAQAVSRFFNTDTMPKFDAWDRALAAFARIKEGQLEGARWMPAPPPSARCT